jgi:ribosomal protein S18 acetylase RimI-like enzyme
MFEIRREDSIERYLASWERCMWSAPWFDSDILFWYDREEELEELRSVFGSKNVFLVAYEEGGSEPLGVLSAVMRGDTGRMLHWQPWVIPEWKTEGVGEALIAEATTAFRDMGARKMTFSIRYPCNAPESGAWLISLYMRCGFEQRGPIGLEMLIDLEHAETRPPPIEGMEITGRETLGVDDLVDYTLKAFGSEPVDRNYFSWDTLTTTRDGAQNFFEELIKGDRGYSPPEFFRVALVGGEPVGFAGSFASKTDDSRGIIGPVGVFPEYRRMGIGSAVVLSALEVLRENGYRHAALGTQVDNLRAVALYEGLGFDDAFHGVILEKELG